MSDKSFTGLQLPDIPANDSPRVADPGFIRIYFKDGLAYGRKPDGTEFLIGGAGPKIRYYETTTNSAGQWSVGYSDFSRVDFVTPVAIHETGSIGEQKIATLHRYSNTSANGRVIEPNTITTLIIGGGEGSEYSESGVRVRVRVEGA